VKKTNQFFRVNPVSILYIYIYMSLFGFFVGFIIIYSIFMLEKTTVEKFQDSPLYSHFPKYIPRQLDGVAGPYLNNFNRPTNWTTDDQYLWPYWSWDRPQTGFLRPGPFYPYYNAPF
jgi:hypothetical protein